ncbi:phage tail tube protein [Konateibacter massiliensis]|uniref:phage tail tube protein n=1 Tax=Konateibacter massiliensis TaxID=2002841 RepID=UPI001F2D3CD3|nr:phage tail tube protein [Konateibacter massiliensis]
MLKMNLQHFAETTMIARDAVSAKLGSCYITIGDNRYLLMQLKNIEVKYEKSKSEVAILGRTTNGNKANGGKITGSATIYHNTDIFTEMIYKYQETGEDLYFDMVLTNDDPTSAAGSRSVTINGCNIDGTTIASVDAEGEWLEQSIDFTAERFDIAKAFTILSGMK